MISEVLLAPIIPQFCHSVILFCSCSNVHRTVFMDIWRGGSPRQLWRDISMTQDKQMQTHKTMGVVICCWFWWVFLGGFLFVCLLFWFLVCFLCFICLFGLGFCLGFACVFFFYLFVLIWFGFLMFVCWFLGLFIWFCFENFICLGVFLFFFFPLPLPIVSCNWTTGKWRLFTYWLVNYLTRAAIWCLSYI